jgi:hypothetical protein
LPASNTLFLNLQAEQLRYLSFRIVRLQWAENSQATHAFGFPGYLSAENRWMQSDEASGDQRTRCLAENGGVE